MLSFLGVHRAIRMVFSRVPDRCRDDSQHLVRISQGGLLTRFGLTQLSTYDEYTPDHDDREGREQTARGNTVDAGANDFHRRCSHSDNVCYGLIRVKPPMPREHRGRRLPATVLARLADKSIRGS